MLTKLKTIKHEDKSKDFNKVFLLLLVFDSFSTNYKVQFTNLISFTNIRDKNKGLKPNKKSKTKIFFF